MIEVLSAPGHVAAFRASGKITGPEYDQLTEQLDAKLQQHGRIGVYVDVLGLSDMTAEAVAKRFRYGLSKLGELDHFARMAIVTDKEWIRAVSDFSSKILPQTQIRAFDESERDEALAWASGPPAG